MPTLGEVAAKIEFWAPGQWADADDATGLQLGDRSRPIHGILVTLDITPAVVEEAAGLSLDLIISHHPLIFRPLATINPRLWPGPTLQALIQNDISLYVAHTNLDAAPIGPSHLLAHALALEETEPLVRATAIPSRPEVCAGFGRVGNLPTPIPLAVLHERLTAMLPDASLEIHGSVDTVSRVAICSGSGRSLVSAALESGAQVYLTGECSYHAVLEGVQDGLVIIEAGHYHTEALLVQPLAVSLANEFPGLSVHSSTVITDPRRRTPL